MPRRRGRKCDQCVGTVSDLTRGGLSGTSAKPTSHVERRGENRQESAEAVVPVLQKAGKGRTPWWRLASGAFDGACRKQPSPHDGTYRRGGEGEALKAYRRAEHAPGTNQGGDQRTGVHTLIRHTWRTAGCGPACPVGWGEGVARPPPTQLCGVAQSRWLGSPQSSVAWLGGSSSSEPR